MSEKIVKIQYFSSTLEHVLKIGKIQEMHVDQVDGVPVLRITCLESDKDEYQTVKPMTEKRPVKKPKNEPEEDDERGSKGKPGILASMNSNLNPFSEENWKNKNPPDWMR